MARYTGPVCRLCRREKMKLFLKGPKCDSMKCPIERRPYPPGDHGRGRIRESEYMIQLREKAWPSGRLLPLARRLRERCRHNGVTFVVNDRVDLAIVGVALPDSRTRLHAALERLQPRYVLPSHQDNFFRPLSAGFQFGPLTDFPRVQRECAQQNGGHLILLDYFRTWTLPKAAGSKSQSPNPKQRVKSQLGNGRQNQAPRS